MLYYYYCILLSLFVALLGFSKTKSNLLLLLLFIELMLLSINTLLLFISISLNDMLGELLALFVLNLAAAESSIGLAIILVYYRICNSINIEYITFLKG